MKDRTITFRANDETMEQLLKVLQSVDSVELGRVFDFDLATEIDRIGLAREAAVEQAFEAVDTDRPLDDDNIIDDAVKREREVLANVGKDAERVFLKVHPHRNVPIVQMVRDTIAKIEGDKARFEAQ